MPQREKLGHIYQKEDKLQDELQKEATVLGVIQILCGLMISSLGAIMVFAPYSSHFNPAVSTILMSGYPFVGALCVSRLGSRRGNVLYKCQEAVKPWSNSVPRGGEVGKEGSGF